MCNFSLCLPIGKNLSCLQINAAIRASSESLHTVLQLSSRQISSIPVLADDPPKRRASPDLQREPAKVFYFKHIATTLKSLPDCWLYIVLHVNSTVINKERTFLLA